MSYHRDYHEFDFDGDLIDMMCPMTDLDKQIAKYGAEAVLKTPSKMKKLEMLDTDHALGWIDFRTILAGDSDEGVFFTLTYNLKDDTWYASIKDVNYEPLCPDFDVSDEDASTMISAEDYNCIKQLHTDHKKTEGQITEATPSPALQDAFKEVIRLAKNGQQAWWTDNLKNTNNTYIKQVEEYYNEKYSK